MELHLDLLGGLAGDMFVAALLDLAPEMEPFVAESLSRIELLAGVSARVMPHNDGVLAGRRFVVERGAGAAHGHPADHHHHHVAWRKIRAALQASPLDADIIRHATAIFARLAEAEARIHGLPVERVSFHEVGAWDSIADIVAAATLIARLGATRWTVSAVPLGSGRVRTDHGPLPVPAPAAALLLEGFAVVDDGIAGERVTPTGAAILRHLCDPAARAAGPRRLAGSGVGFGTRRLAGISNCVRVLRFEAAGEADVPSDRVAEIAFEIDDQTGEDLAQGLERIRSHPAVLDAVQMPAFGKKGRMMAAIRVLARAEALDEVTALCFAETTTIGLRRQIVERATLPRSLAAVDLGGRPVRVKRARRPGGETVKAEAEDVAEAAGEAGRTAMRRAAERLAMEERT